MGMLSSHHRPSCWLRRRAKCLRRWRALRCFDFQGLSTRGEFWGFVALFVALFRGVLMSEDPFLAGALVGMWFALNIVPSFSIQVRRLHDSGRSGWWSLLLIVPLVGSIALLVMLLKPSLKGARNKYAPRNVSASVSKQTLIPLAELERAAVLRAHGHLTDEEFSARKHCLFRPTSK